jgi:metalloprotease
MNTWMRRAAVATMIGAMVTACATQTAQAPPRRAEAPASTPTKAVDASQAARLQQIMIPLLKAMDHPIPLNQVKVGLISDPHINAANAGGGEFYVTTGLLEKANDDQLRAVLAHEIAHADLGHVTKLKTLGTGLNIGMILLDQIIPGSRALTPLAGQLVANAYTRSEEYQADSHGVDILRRAGYDGKALMANTLTWLQQTEGASGGGFFATHPATGDRVQAVLNKK